MPARVTPLEKRPSAFAAGPIDTGPIGTRRLFSRITLVSFVLCVLVPLALSVIYFGFIASDRYAVEVKFAIRSPTGAASPDLLGMVTGVSGSSATQADSYMVIDFLESRQFVDEIASRLDLQAIYGGETVDVVSRLKEGATAEEIVAYLPWRISPYFDSNTQIVTVETQAFTPEDARLIAESVLVSTGDLINNISERARQDTVRLAEAEVARAEEALKDQRAKIGEFRETEQKIDPRTNVAAQENVLSLLNVELSRSLTEMSTLRVFMSADAPSVRVLQSRIDSLESQIAAERTRVGAGTDAATGAVTGTGADGSSTAGVETSLPNLTASITQYEALVVDLDFRQRAYLSALSSLELARIEADRQQRYVAAFVLPSTPEEALYPRVPLTLAMIATVAFLAWGVILMFVNIVREHVQ